MFACERETESVLVVHASERKFVGVCVRARVRVRVWVRVIISIYLFLFSNTIYEVCNT